MKNYSAGATGIIKSSELDKIIKDVKIQIRKLVQGYKEQIQRIGNILNEQKLVKEEDICTEIKNALRDEIKERLVSSDTIERSCPEEWKRKTKPKDNKEPQLRIFEGKNQLEQERETVTCTNLNATPEGQVLKQEYRASDSSVSEEHIVKQQEMIKDQEQELEKLRPVAEKSITERDANYNELSKPQLITLIRQRDEQIIYLQEKHAQKINKITELEAALAQTSFTLADQMPKTEIKEVGVDLEKFGAYLFAAIRNRKKRCSIQIDQTGNAIRLSTAAEETNKVTRPI